MGYLNIHNLGKVYKRYPNNRARLLEWINPTRQRHARHWALRGVNFEIKSGEAVGIIGNNGAGKSTLLKMIVGTTQPSEGSIERGGRIAALLELGMGFHPEFTGRQNAYMSGQILGFTGQQISELMPAIEAFAEIGDYLDQPLRTYSSGMIVRLAFSVATVVQPEILIVDEALSVGDTYFQHKSFERIRQYRDSGSTTLLFVSHSPGAIKTLCNRAILIDQGIMIRDGEPDTVLDYYNAIIAKQTADQQIREDESETKKSVIRSGNRAAVIQFVDMLDAHGSVRAIKIGDAARFRVWIEIHETLTDLTVGLLIRDRLGNDVFGTNTWHLGNSRRNVRPGENLSVDFEFPALNLGVGNYSVSFALHSGDNHIINNYDWWNQALVFQVILGSGPLSIGVSYLPVISRWNE